MKALVIVFMVVGALLSEYGVPQKPWGKEASLKASAERAVRDLETTFRSTESTPGGAFVRRLTPQAKIVLSLLGCDISLDGQVSIAKTLRDYQPLLAGLELEPSNVIVQESAGRLASVFVQVIVSDEVASVHEPVMLKLGFIRVGDEWLIHHAVTAEGYMSLI